METFINIVILVVFLGAYYLIKNTYNYRVHIRPVEVKNEQLQKVFHEKDQKLMNALEKVDITPKSNWYAYHEFKQPRLDFYLKHLKNICDFTTVKGFDKNSLHDLARDIERLYNEAKDAYETYENSSVNLNGLRSKYKL